MYLVDSLNIARESLSFVTTNRNFKIWYYNEYRFYEYYNPSEGFVDLHMSSDEVFVPGARYQHRIETHLDPRGFYITTLPRTNKILYLEDEHGLHRLGNFAVQHPVYVREKFVDPDGVLHIRFSDIVIARSSNFHSPTERFFVELRGSQLTFHDQPAYVHYFDLHNVYLGTVYPRYPRSMLRPPGSPTLRIRGDKLIVSWTGSGYDFYDVLMAPNYPGSGWDVLLTNIVGHTIARDIPYQQTSQSYKFMVVGTRSTDSGVIRKRSSESYFVLPANTLVNTKPIGVAFGQEVLKRWKHHGTINCW